MLIDCSDVDVDLDGSYFGGFVCLFGSCRLRGVDSDSLVRLDPLFECMRHFGCVGTGYCSSLMILIVVVVDFRGSVGVCFGCFCSFLVAMRTCRRRSRYCYCSMKLVCLHHCLKSHRDKH